MFQLNDSVRYRDINLRARAGTVIQIIDAKHVRICWSLFGGKLVESIEWIANLEQIEAKQTVVDDGMGGTYRPGVILSID